MIKWAILSNWNPKSRSKKPHNVYSMNDPELLTKYDSSGIINMRGSEPANKINTYQKSWIDGLTRIPVSQINMLS